MKFIYYSLSNNIVNKLKMNNLVKLTLKHYEVLPLVAVVSGGLVLATAISVKTCLYTNDVRFNKTDRNDPLYFMKQDNSVKSINRQDDPFTITSQLTIE